MKREKTGQKELFLDDCPEGWRFGWSRVRVERLPAAVAIEAAAVASEVSGWMVAAESAILHVATSEARFTADQVWAELERRGCEALPSDARAMGGALRRAARAGLIGRLTGEYRVSVRAERHGGPVQVWESKIVTSGKTEEPR